MNSEQILAAIEDAITDEDAEAAVTQITRLLALRIPVPQGDRTGATA